MKKFLIAAVAVATLAGGAGAASAQSYGAPHGPDRGYSDGYRDDDRGDRGGYGGGRGHGSDMINAREAQLAMRIMRGERSGRLGRREARFLRGDLAQIEGLERQFRMSHGLDRREVAILNNRLDRLEHRVFAEMRDGRAYGQGYGGGYRPH